LQLLEISQLVQPQDAEPPQVGVERIAFIDQQFAADNLVARSRVAGKIDPADEELVALVEPKREVDLVSSRNRLRLWLHQEVDVTEPAVEFAQLLESLLKFFGRKRVALLHPEHLR